MFDYITGKLTFSSLQKVTLDVQGLGYQLFICVSDYALLPKIGEMLTLFTVTVIREDAHKMYGFYSQEKRSLFETLIEISGIGPKTALALIGHMDLTTFQNAIIQGNAQLICKIPGVGKKTSERLIIEMRDKVKTLATQEPSFKQEGMEVDAISALVHLGYHLSSAQKAIKTVLKEGNKHSLPELITAALRQI